MNGGAGMKNRHSIRKAEYDYAAPGDYFVTLCTRNRDPLLGRIAEGKVFLSAFGRIADDEWHVLPERFPMIRLDEFTIMPNHVHGIVTVVGAPLAGARPVDQPHRVDRGRPVVPRSGSAAPVRWCG